MIPVAIMVHVDNTQAAIDWYQQAFPDAILKSVPGTNFKVLELGNISIEIVPAGEKVSSGKSGTVLYWQVDNLVSEVERFKQLGSVVYRGPMQIENGLSMCQVTDTFGNLIGLRGRATGSPAQ